MKFCQFVACLYPHIFTNFSRFILMFNKMALFLLGVLIVLTFRVSPSQTALTSSPMTWFLQKFKDSEGPYEGYSRRITLIKDSTFISNLIRFSSHSSI